MPKLTLPYLQKLLLEQRVDILEQAVQSGMKLLESLELLLHDTKDQKEAPKWIRTINDIATRSKPADAVIPIVGMTGAGKSSLINALLGEKRIVPTSCMRACTAVVTEIRYNHVNDPAKLYAQRSSLSQSKSGRGS